MDRVYIVVLIACSAAVMGLVLWRLSHLHAHPLPSRGRLLNEWIWTVVPVAILVGLLWRVLVSK
ncbi:MAG: hypothetical protein ACRD0Y_02115 [Terriglobales bacterium]